MWPRLSVAAPRQSTRSIPATRARSDPAGSMPGRWPAGLKMAPTPGLLLVRVAEPASGEPGPGDEYSLSTSPIPATTRRGKNPTARFPGGVPGRSIASPSPDGRDAATVLPANPGNDAGDQVGDTGRQATYQHCLPGSAGRRYAGEARFDPTEHGQGDERYDGREK